MMNVNEYRRVLSSLAITVVLMIPMAQSRANDLEKEVTVSTSGAAVGVGFNEGSGDGLNWTAEDQTKQLKITLKAPGTKQIKCSDPNWGEGITWTCDDADQWASEHLYVTVFFTADRSHSVLFFGQIRGGGGGGGQGAPPTWEAGVILADIQGDADNDSWAPQRPPGTVEAERQEEEVAEQGSGNSLGLIVPLNRGYEEGDTSEDYLHEGIVLSDPDLVRVRLLLHLPEDVEDIAKERTVMLTYDNSKFLVYKVSGTSASVISANTEYPVDTFEVDNELRIEGISASSSRGGDSILVTLEPGRGDVSRDELVLTVVTVEIDAFMQGDSSRKIEAINVRTQPINTVASGYVRFKGEVFPTSVDDDFHYTWSATYGVLVNPTAGAGSSYLQVKWDGPSVHEQETTIDLKLRTNESGPPLISIAGGVRTIRPYVVRVKFVDDTWWNNEEQQIHDSYDPEYDVIANEYGPICYRKNTGMQFEVDMAGAPDNDTTNDLTKKTEICVYATCTYGSGPTTNVCRGDGWGTGYIDSTTEDWSHRDFDTLILETLDALPDNVIEYENLQIQWRFEVKNSSGQWVIAYNAPGKSYSQLTTHAEVEEATGRTYGLYVVYGLHKFTSDTEFVKEILDYGCEWAEGENSPDPIRQALLDGGFQGGAGSPFQYGSGGNCWYLASDFARLCKTLGIDASLRKWTGASYPYKKGEMWRLQPGTFDPVGPMTWAGFQVAFAWHGPGGEFGWGYHEWAESGSSQYDPSAAEVHSGNWGSYEDACFAKYLRVLTVDLGGMPLTAVWDANQAGQDQGCEDTGETTANDTVLLWVAPPGSPP